MSLPVFQATIVNEFGEVIPSPVMTILDESTGQPAILFSDRNGTVPLGTNGVFTGGTDGFAQFFTAAGNYRVKAELLSAGFEQTWDFVAMVGDAAFYQVGTGASQIPTNGDLPSFGTAATANVQTSPTDTTAGRTLMTDALDADGNVWGASNVEYGSNASGQYWKYPDGLLICKKPFSFVSGVDINIALTYGGFRSSGPDQSLPHAFVDAGYTVVASASEFEINSAQPNTASSFFFGFKSINSAAGVGVNYSWIAIGRWK